VVLAQAHGVSLPPSTIRNILRRHSIRCRKYRTGNGGRRYGVHLSAFQPLEFWQIKKPFLPLLMGAFSGRSSPGTSSLPVMPSPTPMNSTLPPPCLLALGFWGAGKTTVLRLEDWEQESIFDHLGVMLLSIPPREKTVSVHTIPMMQNSLP